MRLVKTHSRLLTPLSGFESIVTDQVVHSVGKYTHVLSQDGFRIGPRVHLLLHFALEIKFVLNFKLTMSENDLPLAEGSPSWT